MMAARGVGIFAFVEEWSGKIIKLIRIQFFLLQEWLKTWKEVAQQLKRERRVCESRVTGKQIPWGWRSATSKCLRMPMGINGRE
jgi:hypothetical protein